MSERAKVLREVADHARDLGTLGFFRWLHSEVERAEREEASAEPLESLNTDLLRQEAEEA